MITRTDRCVLRDGKLWGESPMGHLYRLLNLFGGRVRMEPVRPQDVVQVGDQLYDVTYRFTILPEEPDYCI